MERITRSPSKPIKKPEGLSEVKDGDKVTVTYTGTVNEVDAFDGTILSVAKAK